MLRTDELAMEPEASNVAVARRWVAERLPEWATDLRDVVLLMTSELVTNGVVHARTELILQLAITEKEVVVGVHDLDLGRRELPGSDREGGRGLSLLEHLATSSGMVRHPGGGKTYWFSVTA